MQLTLSLVRIESCMRLIDNYRDLVFATLMLDVLPNQYRTPPDRIKNS